MGLPPRSKAPRGAAGGWGEFGRELWQRGSSGRTGWEGLGGGGGASAAAVERVGSPHRADAAARDNWSAEGRAGWRLGGMGKGLCALPAAGEAVGARGAVCHSWGECVLCKSAKFTWLVRAKAASGAPAQWEECAVDVKEDVQRGGRGCAGLWRRAGGWQCTPGCSSLWAGTGWCGSVRRARVLPREIWGCPPATGPGSERHALRWRAALAAPAPGAPPQ